LELGKVVMIMSESEAILEAIRQRRETRDRLMLQNLIPILDQLRTTVDTWVDEEFKDLEEEISHVDGFAPRDSASERISRFRVEVSNIRNVKLPKALKQLDELLDFIKRGKFKSAKEAMNMLKQKLAPILLVAFNLSEARERLDGMADMIPIIQLPPRPPLPSHRENEEGN